MLDLPLHLTRIVPVVLFYLLYLKILDLLQALVPHQIFDTRFAFPSARKCERISLFRLWLILFSFIPLCVTFGFVISVHVCAISSDFQLKPLLRSVNVLMVTLLSKYRYNEVIIGHEFDWRLHVLRAGPLPKYRLPLWPWHLVTVSCYMYYTICCIGLAFPIHFKLRFHTMSIL